MNDDPTVEQMRPSAGSQERPGAQSTPVQGRAAERTWLSSFTVILGIVLGGASIILSLAVAGSSVEVDAPPPTWAVLTFAVCVSAALAMVVSAAKMHHGDNHRALWDEQSTMYGVLLFIATFSVPAAIMVTYEAAPLVAYLLGWTGAAILAILTFALMETWAAVQSRRKTPKVFGLVAAMCCVLVLGSCSAPAVAEGRTRYTFHLHGDGEGATGADPTDASADGTAGAHGDEDGGDGDPYDVACATQPGDGARPPADPKEMADAANIGAGADFGCLRPAGPPSGGSVVQSFEREDARLLGSRIGAGVVSYPYTKEFESQVGGVEADVALGQITTRVPCGPGADMHIVVGERGTSKYLMSRTIGTRSDGLGGTPYVTPGALLGSWDAERAGGRVLVAVAALETSGTTVRQRFVDVLDPDGRVYALEGRATPGLAVTGQVGPSASEIFRSCNPDSSSVPRSLQFA